MSETHNTEQWLDDINNPLEPIKVQSALNSEIMKLDYLREHKPEYINELDGTIIAALLFVQKIQNLRLIDVDKLIDKLGISDEDILFKEILDNEPTVNVKNNIYGNVITHNGFEDDYYEYCSICGSKDVSKGDNFCSNCGIKINNKEGK